LKKNVSTNETINFRKIKETKKHPCGKKLLVRLSF